MEQLVQELKKVLAFKNTTDTGDIVLVAAKDPEMLVYARVGEIERDETRHDEWWHVSLHLLSLPIQSVVWTLREPQFTGEEIFTMGGNPHFIKAIKFAEELTTDSSTVSPSGKKEATIKKFKIVK